MKKRLLSLILVIALALTALPFTAFAQTNGLMYGDVNLDGDIDLLDILTMKLYLVEDNPADFSFENADVNADNEVDLVDLLILKKYLAEWDGIHLGPALVTVSFYDGGNLIDSLIATKGYPLGEVPSAAKSSKANAILEGYYTDKELTSPFYAENPVDGNMSVYAKYTAMEDMVEDSPVSFARMDQPANTTFEIKRLSGEILPQNAAALVVKDGSDPITVTITDDNNDGIYTVKAPNGYNEGSSYELNLADGWCFADKDSNIKTAAFSIAKQTVNNIAMNASNHYVKYSDPALLSAGSIVTCEGVNVGDLICFYKTTSPKNRDYTSGNAYMDDPETWFKAGSISGNKVTLAALEESDNEKMYDIPDNFPVIGSLPSGNGGKLTLAPDSDGYTLDTSAYALMIGEENGNLNYAIGKVSVGDFISVYASQDNINANNVYYGKITDYNSITGEITYVKSSAEEIETAADMYIKPVVSGEELVSEEAKARIESTVYSQVENSGFAKQAAEQLAYMAVKTDGFKSMPGVKVLLTDENGQAVSAAKLAARNISKGFELKDGVKLKVEVITSGDQLHFKDRGAVQLAVGINAQYEIEAQDGKVMLNLDASFVQEIALGITANGELVKTKLLGIIPVPCGVKVGASVDIKSFTGIRIDAQAYTEAEKDAGLMDQLKNALKNPQKIGDLLPDKLGSLKKGLNTAGDVINKIQEIKGKLEQAKKDVQKVKEYTEDIKMLWEALDGIVSMPNEQEWEELCDRLGETNISKDLMDMMDITAETELNADRYADGMSDLLAKYSEMLDKETDWVKLVDKEMCKSEIRVCGLAIAFSANFVVRADVNVAMGASLQYEVGKRYTFWVKFGLFKPSAGSETIDLIDEQFAFQYYVMGKMGLKMGIKGAISFAIGSSDIASVGISLEFGPYVKLYGFFVYDYQRMRGANSSQTVTATKMGGAIYMDFGLYLIISLDAEAIGGMFEASYDFVNKEYPLVVAGTKIYPYEFNLKPTSDDKLCVYDTDKDSSNGISMRLPSHYRNLTCVDMATGKNTIKSFNIDKYNITFSSPNFSLAYDMYNSPVINVNVPENTRYMSCDMTITYKGNKLPFSNYDMQLTVPVYWTNLTEEERVEYTANIRLGNETDGYETVWSHRAYKGEEFTLPTVDELKEIVGYDSAKYDSFEFENAGQKVSIIADTDYVCNVSYKPYTVTVSGIQNADGTTASQRFTTYYGKAFDFSKLENTGINKPNVDPDKAKFTKFTGVSTTAVIQTGTDEYGSPVTDVIDLNEPITGKAAQAIAEGKVQAFADYADNSVLVTYKFVGIDAEDHIERIKKSTASTFDYNAVVAENGMAVKTISPEPGIINSSIVYTVECCEIVGEKYTLLFEENGGSTVQDIERVGGSLIGALPAPARRGYSFIGWFSDSELKTPFTSRLMPKENKTLYAKWEAKTVKVTLDVNNGNDWIPPESGIRSVSFGSAYGELPMATRAGYGFAGWFTAKNGGSEVLSTNTVDSESDITLYAHWRLLVTIESEGAFTFTPIEETYNGTAFAPVYGNIPAGNAERPLTIKDFTFKYKKQGEDAYITGEPINAGTYDVVICREADNYYNAFEISAVGVVKINKTVFEIKERPTKDDFTFKQTKFCEILLTMNESGYAKLPADRENFDITYGLHYSVTNHSVFGKVKLGTPLKVQPFNYSDWKQTSYKLEVKITNPNYEFLLPDLTGTWSYVPFSGNFGIEKWAPNQGESGGIEQKEFTVENNAFTITTPGQLLYLKQKVYEGNKAYNSPDITYTLGSDLDMYGYYWSSPIGSTSYGRQGFKANFDGAGHTISGLYAKSADAEGRLALFDGVSGTIKNLKVEDSFFYGENCGGIAVSLWGGTIENCSVDVIMGGEKFSTEYDDNINIGGMAAYMLSDSNIINCTSSGIFFRKLNGKGTAYIGGMVGEAHGATSGSTAEGAISGCINKATLSGEYSGGIIGYLNGVFNIENNKFDQGTPAKEIGTLSAY